MKRILVVEDDADIAELLRHYLERAGYEVEVLGHGTDAVARVRELQPDLVILDRMLPGLDGLEICRLLRVQPSTADMPVMMLTARAEESDRIVGLELGADDYLGKPFNPRELAARVRAVLRRGRPEAEKPESETYRFAGFAVDTQTRTVRDPDGREIDLTGGEFELLLAFLERPGRVLSRDSLLDLTQGRSAEPFDRSIDVLVSRLRRKLGDGGVFRLFKTVRNGGYQLSVSVEKSAS